MAAVEEESNTTGSPATWSDGGGEVESATIKESTFSLENACLSRDLPVLGDST